MAAHWDRRLDTVARELTRCGGDIEQMRSRLKRRLPKLHNQVVASGECRTLLDLWGKSLNVDDNTGAEIVDVDVLQLLYCLTDHTAAVGDHQIPVVHAGIQHTYGYLFSLIETPYGLKRQRWTSGVIDRGFNLRSKPFEPAPSSGTLLLNLTYFLGRFLFRGQRNKLARLRRCGERVDPELLKVSYRACSRIRIVEEMQKSSRQLRVITDLVRFPNSVDAEALLVYGLEYPDDSGIKIVTAFPVSAEAYENLLSQPVGPQKVQLQYNAWANGFERTPQSGRRTITEL